MSILVTGGGIRFREITNRDDDLWFECLADWPADAHGPYTRRRANDAIHNGLLENMECKYPLTDKSDFHHNLVLEFVDGIPLGITRLRIWGMLAWVDFLAFLPAHRGAGHFETVYWLYTYLIFEVYKADTLGHVDFADVHALTNMRARHGGEEGKPEERYARQTDREAIKFTFTRALYEAWPTPYQMKNGTKLDVTSP